MLLHYLISWPLKHGKPGFYSQNTQCMESGFYFQLRVWVNQSVCPTVSLLHWDLSASTSLPLLIQKLITEAVITLSILNYATCSLSLSHSVWYFPLSVGVEIIYNNVTCSRNLQFSLFTLHSLNSATKSTSRTRWSTNRVFYHVSRRTIQTSKQYFMHK